MRGVEPNICFPGVGWLQCFENVVSGVAYADRCGAHTYRRSLPTDCRCSWYRRRCCSCCRCYWCCCRWY